MPKLEERYNAWIDASFKAIIQGDVDTQTSLWAENCTRTEIEAFGDHYTIQGKDAIRKESEGLVTVFTNPKIVKNELLSASQEKGIGNAVVRWTTKDGREASCNFIYVITLDEEGHCVSYTEWNVVKAREA